MKISQGLVVHIVCHKEDVKSASPFVDSLCAAFSRDPRYPFSRELNLPIFTWQEPEFDKQVLCPKRLGNKTVVFAFTSARSCTDAAWTKALNKINQKSKKIFVVPIAITVGGVSIPRRVGLNNVISLFKWDKYQSDLLVVAAAQSICQLCYPKTTAKSVQPLKIFLSHTKSDVVGARVVKQLRDFICTRTTLEKFIDINDIQSGEEFDSKILNEIGKSVFLAIVTDNYSTRRWCQLEAVEAKRKGVPIIVVDCVSRYEDRILPALANVPCVRPALNSDPNGDILLTEDMVRILKAMMMETLRWHYVADVLKQRCHGKGVVLSRPPESNILTDWHQKGVWYPEPQILPAEQEFYFGKNRYLFTPSSCDDGKALSGLKIGISISDPEACYLSDHGLRMDVLTRLSQDIARNVISRGAVLIYGGDFRPKEINGFTGMILDEARIAKTRRKIRAPLVWNYLAWPLHLSRSDQEVEFQNHYTDVSKCIFCEPPKDLLRLEGFRKDEYVEPNTVVNKYAWARGLTWMREVSIRQSDVRICAAGKFSNYKGAMPGVLQEVLIAQKEKKPIYLLGGFGGVTSAIVESILNRTVDPRLSLDWQQRNSLGYSDFVRFSSEQKYPVDYSDLAALTRLSIKDLAKRAGLSVSDYRSLMLSPYVDECVSLILKGLSKRKTKR